MESRRRLASIAAVLAALSTPAAAQIISTALPTTMPGRKAGDRQDRFSAHLMVTPFAKWNYKEVYGALGPPSDIGLIAGTPNSDFMAAGEVAFRIGKTNWSATTGGWYNRIGTKHFNFEGVYVTSNPPLTVDERAQLVVQLTLYEFHLGIFYKSVGVQGGIVHTDQKSNGDWLNVFLGDEEIGNLPGYTPFEETTNDFVLFGVGRKSTHRGGVSAGAGAYFKQGISLEASTSPLRFFETKVVFSAFLTASLSIYEGLGIDASYWYIGKTNDVQGLHDILENPRIASDAQNRLTLGLGFSF